MTESLESLKSEFAIWRASKTHSVEKIPHTLIFRARELLSNLPQTVLCRELGIMPAKLIGKKKSKSKPTSPPKFIELSPSAIPSPSTIPVVATREIRIEIKDRERTIVINLPNEVADLASLFRSPVK